MKWTTLLYLLLLVILVVLEGYICLVTKSTFLTLAAMAAAFGLLSTVFWLTIRGRVAKARKMAIELKERFGTDLAIDGQYTSLAKATIWDQLLGLLGLGWFLKHLVGRTAEVAIDQVVNAGKSEEHVVQEKELRDLLLNLRDDRSSFESVAAVILIVGILCLITLLIP